MVLPIGLPDHAAHAFRETARDATDFGAALSGRFGWLQQDPPVTPGPAAPAPQPGTMGTQPPSPPANEPPVVAEPAPTPAITPTATPEQTASPTATPQSPPPPGQLAPGQQPELTISVTSFIPDATAEAWFVARFGGRYAGDNRDPGQPGTHRTRQQVQVGTDEAGRLVVTVVADIGATHNLDSGEVARQSPDTLREVSRETLPDGAVRVVLAGESANPLEPNSPGITYQVELTIGRLSGGEWQVHVTGNHDLFPAYEVIAQVPSQAQEMIYSYDPRDTGFGPVLGLNVTVPFIGRTEIVGDGVAAPALDPPPPTPHLVPTPAAP
jgi:hypothetical protein